MISELVILILAVTSEVWTKDACFCRTTKNGTRNCIKISSSLDRILVKLQLKSTTVSSLCSTQERISRQDLGISGSGSLGSGSLSVQDGQVSGTGSLNLPSGLGSVSGSLQNGQVSGSADLNLPSGLGSVSAGVQNGQVSASTNVNLPNGLGSVSGSLQNGQVSGNANLNLPNDLGSVSGSLQNGQVSGSGSLNLPGGAGTISGSVQNGQVSGSANVNLPNGLGSVSGSLQNGQVSGSGTLNLPGGTGSVSANLQNGQISGGGSLNLPGGGSMSLGGGSSSGGSSSTGGVDTSQTGFNPTTFTQQANMGGFMQYMQNLMNGGSGGTSGTSGGFQPGGLGGSSSFTPGTGMTSGFGGSGFGSGSGGFGGSGSGTSSGFGGSGFGSSSGGFGGSGSGTSSGFGGSGFGSGSGGFGGSGSGTSSGFGGSGSGFGSNGGGTGTTGGSTGSGSSTSGFGGSGSSSTGGSTGGASNGCSPSAGISSQNPPSGSCLCLTATGVNVHTNGDLHSSSLGTLSSPDCVTYSGSKLTPCLHDANTDDHHAWFRVTIQGKTGWIAGDYLQVADRSKCTSSSSTSSSTGNPSSTSTSSSSTGNPSSTSTSSSSSSGPATSGTTSNCFPGSEMTALSSKISNYEGGARLTAYDAQPNSATVDWTICVGFNLKRSDARSTFQTVLPGVNFDAVYKGAPLTKDQCLKLFAHDLSSVYIQRAISLVGGFVCQLPLNVKIAIVNGFYRGDIGPKTKALMQAKDWCHVSAEYLDNYEYKNCRQLGIAGICPRMEWNAQQFSSMCHGTATSGSSGSTQTSSSGSSTRCSPSTAGISSQNPQSGSCLCLTATGVNVHANGDLHSSSVGTLSSPNCVTYAGSKLTPCLSNSNTDDHYAWFKISSQGQSGWIAGDYLQVSDHSKCTQQASSGGGGTPSANGMCNDPVAKDLACKLLALYNQQKIGLWNQHSSRKPDNAYAVNNIKDTCNGRAASRSSYSCSIDPTGAPGGSICLSSKMLQYVYDLAVKGYLHVNELAGACHHHGSRHYSGVAVDLDPGSRGNEFLSACSAHGCTPIDERSCCNHVHCQC